MKRMVVLSILSLLVIPVGQILAQGDTLHISARIPSQFLFGSPDTIIAGDFFVEIVWDYDWVSNPLVDTLLGGGYVLQVNGVGISKVAATGALPAPYDNIVLKNGFENTTYWNTFGSPADWPFAFLTSDFDGAMPDFFGHAFAGTKGYPGLPPLGPVAHYEMHYTGTVGGSIQIDSVFINDPAFDWAFDVPATYIGINLPIGTPPDLPPVFDNCPSQLTVQHHVNFNYDFNGHDLDGTAGGISFELVSGPGSINAATGAWTYNPPCTDVGQPLTLVVCVEDANNPCPTGNECTVNLIVNNSAPVLGGICGQTFTVSEGGRSVQFTATDANSTGDTKTWSIEAVNPMPTGTYSINSSGLLTFDPTPGEIGNQYVFTVRVTDCNGEFDECNVTFNVITYVCGDANGDQIINILDITFLINYLFKGGPSPIPLEAGDTNGDSTINIVDMVYLIAHLYKGGPAPLCP